MNAFWAKYGCTKCEKYKLLVLEVDISDSKTKFINDYVKKLNVQCPAVAKGDGAEQLCKAVDHEGAGAAGPDYLIKPDKTYKLFSKNAEIDNAGGNVQHVCPVSVVCQHQHPVETRAVTVRPLNAGRLAVSVPGAATYRISACTVDGRRVADTRARLEAGDNTVGLAGASGTARILLISVKGENGCTALKIFRDNK